MSDQAQTTLPSVEQPPAEPAKTSRNALGLGEFYRLGQWLADADLSAYASLAELAFGAGQVLGFTVSAANMSTALGITGRSTEFTTERQRQAAKRIKDARIREAAPQLLDALRDCLELVGNEYDDDPVLRNARLAIAAAEGQS